MGLGTLLCRCNSSRPASADDGGADVSASVGDAGGDGPGDDVGLADVVADGTDEDSGSCDKSGDPSSWPCPIGDSDGVFVDGASGHDNAAGTKGDPLQSIQAGIAKAASGLGRVFACAGGYDETLTMSGALKTDGVAVFGGWDCAQWAYSASNVVTVESSGTGYVVELDGLSKGARFEDIVLHAHDGLFYGDSSIAVFANASQAVSFSRVTIIAGVGVYGLDAPPNGPFATYAPSGNPGTTQASGGSQPYSCANGTGSSVGGAGGPPSATGADGQDGTPLGNANHGVHTADDCSNGSAGRTGVHGAGASFGGSGAQLLGTLDGSGWHPAGGGTGSDGFSAQGGGGGASLDLSGGGSGGGAGGCGGVGSGGGSGGGASVGLLALASQIALTSVQVYTKGAGRGGAGASGQVGQTGGAPGDVIPLGDAGVNTACRGGEGGFGGSGAGGGGGAGGVSAGVLRKSGALTLDGAPVDQELPIVGAWAIGANGDAGAAGAGGVPAGAGANAGADGTAGLSGISKAVLIAP
jgi:hypothetical protein